MFTKKTGTTNKALTIGDKTKKEYRDVLTMT